MNPASISGISRLIDVRHPSNLFVVVAAVAAGAAAVAWRYFGPGDDILRWGILSGGAVFLAWAIAREIDPDRPIGASVGALLALPLLAYGAPSLAAAAGVLLATRIAARTTGRSPTGVDAVVLIGLGAYLGRSPETWPAALIVVAALVVDRHLHDGPRSSSWMAGGVLLASIGAALVAAPDVVWERLSRSGGMLLALSLIAGAWLLGRTRTPVSVCDVYGRPLHAPRLLSARVLGLVGLTVPAIALGAQGLAAMTIPAAAYIGVAIAELFRADVAEHLVAKTSTRD